MSTPYHFPFTLSAKIQEDFYTEKFISNHNILLLFDSISVNTISLPFYSFRKFSKRLLHRKVYFCSQPSPPLRQCQCQYHITSLFSLSANFQRDFYTEKFIFLYNILLLFDSTNVNTISLPFYSFR